MSLEKRCPAVIWGLLTIIRRPWFAAIAVILPIGIVIVVDFILNGTIHPVIELKEEPRPADYTWESPQKMTRVFLSPTSPIDITPSDAEDKPIDFLKAQLSKTDDDLLMLVAADPVGPLEGPYSFYFYEIPFDAPERATARKIMVSYNPAYGYPGPETTIHALLNDEACFYPASFGSGPYKWYGGWLFSFDIAAGTTRGLPWDPFGERRLVNPIYYLQDEGREAVPWVPPVAEWGVLGFDVSKDLIYLALAGDEESMERKVRSRRIPRTQLIAIDRRGKVKHRRTIPLHFSSLPVGPSQSIEVRFSDDKVYVLNRVPCAFAVHHYSGIGIAYASELLGSTFGGSAQVEPAAFLDIAPFDKFVIAKPRIDVYTSDLKHVASQELHMANHVGYFYRMDIDAKNDDLLLQEYYSGKVWRYDLDLKLKEHTRFGRNYDFNWMECVTQDVVLHDDKVYLAGFGPSYEYEGNVLEYSAGLSSEGNEGTSRPDD